MASPEDTPKVVRSHAELHRLLPRLFAQQEQRPALAIAALANPVLALRELGYELAPEIARHMERLARFGAAATAEIEAIETELQRDLGPEVSIDDGPALAKAVIAHLPKALLEADFPRAELAEGAVAVTGPEAGRAQTGPEPMKPGTDKAGPQAGGKTAPRAATVRDRLASLLAAPVQRRFDAVRRLPDPLAVLKGRAPLLDAVIRLREIEGSRSRLAEPQVFRGILDGSIATPITRVRFRPTRRPPPEA